MGVRFEWVVDANADKIYLYIGLFCQDGETIFEKLDLIQPNLFCNHELCIVFFLITSLQWTIGYWDAILRNSFKEGGV